MVRKSRRITRELTTDEQSRLERQRVQIAEELPDLIQRNQLAKRAQAENTFSGELRRQIHTGGVPITEIARRANIDLTELDEFLTGERTLQSDVIDRLTAALGCELVNKT